MDSTTSLCRAAEISRFEVQRMKQILRENIGRLTNAKYPLPWQFQNHCPKQWAAPPSWLCLPHRRHPKNWTSRKLLILSSFLVLATWQHNLAEFFAFSNLFISMQCSMSMCVPVFFLPQVREKTCLIQTEYGVVCWNRIMCVVKNWKFKCLIVMINPSHECTAWTKWPESCHGPSSAS